MPFVFIYTDMYIALLILIAGIGLGKLCSAHLSHGILSRLTLGAIFLLLFLLGVSIGANHNLLCQLPTLGLDALVIAICCIAGSILASVIVTPLVIPRNRKDKDAS